MIRFSQFLNEVFDKVLPFEEIITGFTNGGRKFYRFQIPITTKYIVTEIIQGQVWNNNATYYDISFYQTDKKDGSGKRLYDMARRDAYDSFAIMATVVKIVREYNKEFPLPKKGEYRFSAYASERGKIAVYTRLANRIAKEINGRVEVDADDSTLTYITIHK